MLYTYKNKSQHWVTEVSSDLLSSSWTNCQDKLHHFWRRQLCPCFITQVGIIHARLGNQTLSSIHCGEDMWGCLFCFVVCFVVWGFFLWEKNKFRWEIFKLTLYLEFLTNFSWMHWNLSWIIYKDFLLNYSLPKLSLFFRTLLPVNHIHLIHISANDSWCSGITWRICKFIQVRLASHFQWHYCLLWKMLNFLIRAF